MSQRAGLGGRLLAPTAVCIIALTGCTTTSAGSAARDPGAQPGVVDDALLDPGNYPTRPTPLGAAGDPTIGALVEARRMADYVTGPWEADPALLKPILFGVSPAATPLMADSIGMIMMTKSPQGLALAQHGMLNGYVTGRKAEGQRMLTNAVLRFADPAAAAAAAADLVHANPRPADIPPAVTPAPLPIPGHPDALGSTYSIDSATDHKTWVTVQAFTPHGPFVLFQQADLVGSVGDAAGLVSKTLDLQGPLIDKFVPTDPAQFATLTRDPSGLLAMALPPAGEMPALAINTTVGPHGKLNFLSNPIDDGKVYADAGVDVSVQAEGWLNRARDAAGAAALLAHDVKSMNDDGPSPGAVPNLAGSACEKLTDKSSGEVEFDCVAARGRYEFTVYGHTLKDAQQKAAAQYLMLAAA